tara:strand:+ start:4386 stop:5282 length:897 start_codon:yes stop_codon:yes gene_type:complete
MNKNILMTGVTSRKSQAGLSLIELMIAMTLGLILLSGIVQIFLSSKQSYSSVMNSSQILDNGRLAVQFIGSGVSKSGFWGEPTLARTYGSDSGLVADQYTGVFGESQWVFGQNNDTTNANVIDGTDELFVRFHGDDDTPMTTCNGTDVNQNQIAIERYYIRIITGTERVPSLMCESTVLDFDLSSGISTVPNPVVTNATVLMTGVENLQLQFGLRRLDDDSDNIRFFTANNVPAADWSLIESIRFSVLAVSTDEVNQSTRATGYTMLDITTPVPVDRRARRVFQQSLVTRNTKLPDSF